MSTCSVCKKPIDPGWNIGLVLLTCDGDFACSDTCADKWRKELDHFLEVILPNDRLYAEWLGVPKLFPEQFMKSIEIQL